MLKQRAGYYSTWVKRVSEYYPNGGNICRAYKYSFLENEALIINIKKLMFDTHLVMNCRRQT